MHSPAIAPDAAAAWIAAHQAAIWRYARFLGAGPDRAEDLLHDALLAGIEHGAPELPAERARAWLRTTVRNLWFMELRAASRRPEMRSLEHLDAIWEAHIGDHGEADEHLTALDECLAQLESRPRRALELRYRDGASRTAMARELGISEAGVKALLRRTRELLRQCVERHSEAEGNAR